MSTPRDVAHIRAVVDAVLERARRDVAYLESLRSNPVAILQAAGLCESDARTVGFDEWHLGGERPHGCRRSLPTCRWTDTGAGCVASVCTYVPVTG